MSHPRAVIVSSHWRDPAAELTFVTRSIAGAASRCGPVSVLVPGVRGRREPDGAFDLLGMGEGRAQWPDGLSPACTVVVDEVTSEVATMLTRIAPAGVLYLSGSGEGLDPTWRRLHLVGGGGGGAIDIHVPVNPLAQLHRHHGFGFTGYQLVLSDGSGSKERPPSAAAWLSAAFSEADVVVIENAVASAWRGRALRGRVPVDTRMDLWRLMAHANVCVDLAPGPHIARECIEAQRFATPIIVPASSGAGAVHAQAGGGATFSDEHDLLEAAGTFQSATRRATATASAKAYADAHYGDPVALVRRIEDLLAQPGAQQSPDAAIH